MKFAGYSYLRDELNLPVPNLGLELALGTDKDDRVRKFGNGKLKLLSKKNSQIDNNIFAHLEVAIKYQGIRLVHIYPFLRSIDKNNLEKYIKEQPMARVRRCIWYLYEWLFDDRLNIPDLKKVGYQDLLDSEHYYTTNDGVKDPRTKIVNNLLGNRHFAPLIRKTREIEEWAGKDMIEMAWGRLKALDGVLNPEVLGRSIAYLYTKETRSSIEIENESPNTKRATIFYRVLTTSGTLNLTKNRLIKIQNSIVRSKKKDSDYRTREIYIGETRPSRFNGTEEYIHYIGPKLEHVHSMMEGLLDLHNEILLNNTIPAMMHAALISFGFVYIHPFRDGNGRISRYLIHDVLKARRENEDNFIIPVSASILARIKEYDEVLETVSKPVMALIDYDIDEEDLSLTINNDLQHLYRYPDLTEHVEYLYRMMDTAISDDLIPEIVYIVAYDQAKEIIEDFCDMPNREVDLFIKFAMQNNGKIAKKRRKDFYEWINEEEIVQIEGKLKEVVTSLEEMFRVAEKQPTE